MSRNPYAPWQIINILREAEVSDLARPDRRPALGVLKIVHTHKHLYVYRLILLSLVMRLCARNLLRIERLPPYPSSRREAQALPPRVLVLSSLLRQRAF